MTQQELEDMGLGADFRQQIEPSRRIADYAHSFDYRCYDGSILPRVSDLDSHSGLGFKYWRRGGAEWRELRGLFQNLFSSKYIELVDNLRCHNRSPDSLPSPERSRLGV